eukprot:4187856-Alexandrium_andersonii.AAC.1
MGDRAELGRKLRDQPPEAARRSFRGTFWGKPAGALRKRAVAIRVYEKWAASLGRCPWPLDEACIYEYVAHLRDAEAPATGAKSFRGAVSFAILSSGWTRQQRPWRAPGRR